MKWWERLLGGDERFFWGMIGLLIGACLSLIWKESGLFQIGDVLSFLGAILGAIILVLYAMKPIKTDIEERRAQREQESISARYFLEEAARRDLSKLRDLEEIYSSKVGEKRVWYFAVNGYEYPHKFGNVHPEHLVKLTPKIAKIAAKYLSEAKIFEDRYIFVFKAVEKCRKLNPTLIQTHYVDELEPVLKTTISLIDDYYQNWFSH